MVLTHGVLRVFLAAWLRRRVSNDEAFLEATT